MTHRRDEDACTLSNDDAPSEWGNVGAASDSPRALANTAPSGIQSHYDPSRTKKTYAPKSKELQE